VIAEKRASQALSDEELARRAQAGHRDCFEQLVRRYQVSLLRFINERVHCEADAQDIVQDTFVRAYQRIDRYNDAWRFSTWLFTIGHRLAISHLRSRKPRAMVAAEEITLTPDTHLDNQPGRQMSDAEDRQRFWDAAATVLTDEQMAAVWLYYVEDMGAPEIAKVLGRSWVSVKTMLFRARRRLEPRLAAWVENAPNALSSSHSVGNLFPSPLYAGERVG